MSEETVITGKETEQTEERLFTQEEVNKLVGEARVKVRSQFKDYDQYKAAYEELEKLKEDDKSELQKALDRAESAERERDALRSEKERSAWAEEVSKASGIPTELLQGSTKEEMEEFAERTKHYFEKDSAPVVASDGYAPSAVSGGTNAEKFAAALEGIL